MFLELADQLRQHFGGGHIDAGDRRGIEQYRTGLLRVLDQPHQLFAEVGGVGEEKLPVPADDHQTRHRLGVGGAGDVAVDPLAGDAAEHGDVRAGGALQQRQQREADTDQDPLQDSEQERPGEGDRCRDQVEPGRQPEASSSAGR